MHKSLDLGFSECVAVDVHGNKCIYVFLCAPMHVGQGGTEVCCFHRSIFIASILRGKHEDTAKQTHQA